MERQSPGVKWSVLVAAGALWIAARFGVDSRKAAVGNETYFMDGDRCNSELWVSGATVVSHAPASHQSSSTFYRHNVECKIVFHARHEGWRLMLLFEYLDIPDRTMGDLCTDALYIYDSPTVGSRAVKTAGGNSGLCGDNVPALITSTGRQLTVYFRTDSGGVRGQGFKFVITAFHKGYASEDGGCGLNFKCRSERCIDSELVCDGIPHCGDISDEARCGLTTVPVANAGVAYDETLWDKFISLGTTVCVLVAAATVTVLALLAVCTACLCRRRSRRKRQKKAAGRRPAARGGRCEHSADGGACGQDALLSHSRPPANPYDSGLQRQQVSGDRTGQATLFESPDAAFVLHGNYHPAAAAAVMYHSFSTAAQAGSSASYASHWQDPHESCSHSSGYSSQQTPASGVSAAIQVPSLAVAGAYHQQPMHKLPAVQPWHYSSAASTSTCSRGTSCRT